MLLIHKRAVSLLKGERGEGGGNAFISTIHKKAIFSSKDWLVWFTPIQTFSITKNPFYLIYNYQDSSSCNCYHIFMILNIWSAPKMCFLWQLCTARTPQVPSLNYWNYVIKKPNQMTNRTLNSETRNGSCYWFTYFLIIEGKCGWKVVWNYALCFFWELTLERTWGVLAFFGLSCIIEEKRHIEWLTDFLSSPLSLLTGAQTSVWLSQQVSCFYLEGPYSRNVLE